MTLETHFDDLLEFSETPLPQYDDAAAIESQDNSKKNCDEPTYARVQAKRQSSRSKSSHEWVNVIFIVCEIISLHQVWYLESFLSYFFIFVPFYYQIPVAMVAINLTE